MNIVLPFFGGMPMYHGSGGLAGQYGMEKWRGKALK